MRQQGTNREKRGLRALFSKPARGVNEPPPTSFSHDINIEFEDDTPQKIEAAFRNLGLPMPENKKEFLYGQDGGFLLFLNKCGVVIRIENEFSDNADRINSSPWIARPIASIRAGEAIIEICPGGHQETDREKVKLLRQQLKAQHINFWDSKFSNVGHLPVKTAQFPEGMTVVIDRGAVRWLNRCTKPVRDALLAVAREAMAAQNAFYAPLRQAFAEAWPDAGKMQKFWELCEDYAQQGKLVAGWNEQQPSEAAYERCKHGDNSKTLHASRVAGNYEIRLQQRAAQRVSSSAPAVPRSLRPQA